MPHDNKKILENLKTGIFPSELIEMLKVLKSSVDVPTDENPQTTIDNLKTLCSKITTQLIEASELEVVSKISKKEIFFSSDPKKLTSYVVSEGEKTFLVLNLDMIKKCKNSEELAGIIALALGYEIASRDNIPDTKQDLLTPEQEARAINFAVSFLLKAGYDTKNLTNLLTKEKNTELVANLTQNIEKGDIEKTIYKKRPISPEDKNLALKRLILNATVLHERKGGLVKKDREKTVQEENFTKIREELIEKENQIKDLQKERYKEEKDKVKTKEEIAKMEEEVKDFTFKTPLEIQLEELEYDNLDLKKQLYVLIDEIKKIYPPLSMVEAMDLSKLNSLLRKIITPENNNYVKVNPELKIDDDLKGALKELWLVMNYKKINEKTKSSLLQQGNEIKERWDAHDKYCNEQSSNKKSSNWNNSVIRPESFDCLGKLDKRDQFSPSMLLTKKVEAFKAAKNIEEADNFAGQILELKDELEISDEVFKDIIRKLAPKIPTVILEHENSEEKQISFGNTSNENKNLIFSYELSFLSENQLLTENTSEILAMMGLDKDPYIAAKINKPVAGVDQLRFARGENGSFNGLDSEYYPTDISNQIETQANLNNNFRKVPTDNSKLMQDIKDGSGSIFKMISEQKQLSQKLAELKESLQQPSGIRIFRKVELKNGYFPFTRLVTKVRISNLDSKERKIFTKIALNDPKLFYSMIESPTFYPDAKKFNSSELQKAQKLVNKAISRTKKERLAQEIDLIKKLNDLTNTAKESDGWNLLKSDPAKFIGLYGLYLQSSFPAGENDAPFANKFFSEVSKLLKDEEYNKENLKSSLKRLLSIRSYSSRETEGTDVVSYEQINSHYDSYSLCPFKKDHPCIVFLKKGNPGFNLIGENEKLAFLLRTEEFVHASSIAGIKLKAKGKDQLKQFLSFPENPIESVQDLINTIKTAKDNDAPYHQATIDILVEELLNRHPKRLTAENLLDLSNIVGTGLSKQKNYADSFGVGKITDISKKMMYLDFSLNMRLEKLTENFTSLYIKNISNHIKAGRKDISSLIKDYKEFNSYGWFYNIPEIKNEFLNKIKVEISNTSDDKQRLDLLSSLLSRTINQSDTDKPYKQKTYVYNGVIEDPEIRSWAIQEFVLLKSRTFKGKTEQEIRNGFNELKDLLSPQTFSEVAANIADTIDTNHDLSLYIENLCQAKDSSQFVKQTSEEQNLAYSIFSDLEITLQDLNNKKYTNLHKALHDFLLSPLTEKSTDKSIDLLFTEVEKKLEEERSKAEKSQRENANDEQESDGVIAARAITGQALKELKAQLKTQTIYRLKILHKNFWKTSSEGRMGIIDFLSFPDYSEPRHSTTSNSIITNAFKGKDLDKDNRELALSILKSYAQQLNDDEKRLFAVAIEVATAKQNENQEETSLGKQLALILSYLGPAGTKLAQAISSYSGTPKDVKKDLEQFKTNATPLKRWEVVKLLKKDGIMVGRKLKIGEKEEDFEVTKIGHVVGSGSFGITVFVTVNDGTETGKEVAVTILRENAEKMANREFNLVIKAMETTLKTPKLTDEQKSKTKAILTIVQNAKRASEKEVDMKVAEEQNFSAIQTYHNSTVDAKVRVAGKNYKFTNYVAGFFGRTQNTKTCEKVLGLHFNELSTKTQSERDFKRAVAKAIIATQITAIFQGKKIDSDRHGGNFKIDNNTIYYFDFGMMQTKDVTVEQQKALGIVLARIYRARGQKKGIGDLLQDNVEEFIKEIYAPEVNSNRSVTERLFPTKNEKEEAAEYLRDFVKGMLALGDEMNSMKQSVLMGVFARVLNSENVKTTEVKKAFDTELGRTSLKEKLGMAVAKKILSGKVHVKTAVQVSERKRSSFINNNI